MTFSNTSPISSVHENPTCLIRKLNDSLEKIDVIHFAERINNLAITLFYSRNYGYDRLELIISLLVSLGSNIGKIVIYRECPSRSTVISPSIQYSRPSLALYNSSFAIFNVFSLNSDINTDNYYFSFPLVFRHL